MISRPLTAEDKQWQAKDDARTLAEANVIREDADRMSAAQTAAKQMAEDEREKATALGKVASGKQSTAKRPVGQSAFAAPTGNKASKSDSKGIAEMPVTFLNKKK